MRFFVVVTSTIALSAACVPPAAPCASDDDCPASTRCSPDGTCVAASEGESGEGEGSVGEGEGSVGEGEGSVGEGEGAVGEGEGAVGEGEGAFGEGEGAVGEGEGSLGEGEGEGGGGGGQVLKLVKVFNPAGQTVDIDVHDTVQSQAGTSACALRNVTGTTVHLGCAAALTTVTTKLLATNNASIRIEITFVPSDWIDLERRQRVLVRVDTSAAPGGLLYVPDSVVPQNALDDGHFYYGDKSDAGFERDATGAWTNAPPASDGLLWLYFDAVDVNAALSQLPGRDVWSEIFHFGTAATAAGVSEGGGTIAGSSASPPAGPGVAGKGTTTPPMLTALLSSTQARPTDAAGAVSLFMQVDASAVTNDEVLVDLFAPGVSSTVYDGLSNAEYSLRIAVPGGDTTINHKGLCVHLPATTLFAPTSTGLDGKPHMVTLTWSGSLVDLFVDGALVASGSRNAAPTETMTELAVGSAPARQGTRDYAGLVDEVWVSPSFVTEATLETAAKSVLADPSMVTAFFPLATQAFVVPPTPIDLTTHTSTVALAGDFSQLDGKPATVAIYTASQTPTLAQATTAYGISLATVSSADDGSGVELVRATGTGTFHASGNVSIVHDDSGGVTVDPPSTDVVAVVVLFAGTPPPIAPILASGDVSASSVELSTFAGATTYAAIASPSPPPPALVLVGTPLPPVTSGAGLTLAVTTYFAAANEPTTSFASTSTPAAWITDSFGP